jgi:putative transposase
MLVETDKPHGLRPRIGRISYPLAITRCIQNQKTHPKTFVQNNKTLLQMPDVFSQIYIQIVFAVKNRQALIQPTWEAELYRYATGIVQNKGHKLLAIGGMPDHIHIFIGLKPAESLSELVRDIKKATNDFIKQQRFSNFAFEWQAGYGAFSYSRSHIDAVCRYILNQKEHHQSKTFEDEFMKTLRDFEVEIGQKKIFDFFVPD